jgi:hypothetical protein
MVNRGIPKINNTERAVIAAEDVPWDEVGMLNVYIMEFCQCVVNAASTEKH